MKILLVYPQYPNTFWSLKHSLEFVSKKALMPPLGLLTIASLLPTDFERKLIDLNASKIKDKDLLWADYVFISAMLTQKESAIKIIERCKALGVKTVAGGPLFTGLYEDFPNVDHFVLNEGEVTLPMFLEDLKNGNPKKLYTSDIKPDITNSPIPQWNLVDFKKYVKMPIQYSRGCPFDCEFCDVVNLNGRIPRTKNNLQFIQEIEALCKLGYNLPIFIVDDNFIGNKAKTKNLLRSLIDWRKSKKYTNTFMTETSLNLADDEELLSLMVEAGFDTVFIGLETPSSESLQECGKFQNKNCNLVESVKKIQRYGMEVAAGFIVGFDNDDTSIFARQIEFIQNTGVVVAMVGLLQALPGTKLYERLKNENRLLKNSSGNNTDLSINFLPKMDYNTLIKGYKDIISSIYSPGKYYERVITFLGSYKACHRHPFSLNTLSALIKSIFILGIVEKDRKYYWKIFFVSLFKYPKSFPKAINLAIYYAHFRKIYAEVTVPVKPYD